MLESLMNNTTMLIGGGSAGVLLWILKKVPNEDVCAFIEGLFYGAGKAMTLGLSKWSFTRNFCNNTI